MVVACGLCSKLVVLVFVVAFLVSAGMVYCILPTGLPRSSGGSSTTTVAPVNRLDPPLLNVVAVVRVWLGAALAIE